MKVNFNNGQVVSINEEAQSEPTQYIGYNPSAEIREEEPHSVELSINQNGKYSGKVKVYAKTPEEALKKAGQIAVSIETIIREKNGINAGFKETWNAVNKK